MPLDRPKRRIFSTEFKLKILAEADAATESGQVAAMLRREGLYSSALTDWRRARAAGLLGPVKPGSKPQGTNPLVAENKRLQKEKRTLERRLKRAEPQKPGVVPPLPEPSPAPAGERTDYLAQLRTDYERRMRTELSGLRLSPPPAVELDLPGLVALLEACREALLSDAERSEAARFWRRLRPLEPVQARTFLDGARRRLGPGLHLDVYLQALETQLVRTRSAIKAKGAESGCGKSTALSLFAKSLVASSHQLVALSLTAMAAGGKVIDATAVQQAVVDMEGLWTEQGQTGCRCRRTGADASPGRPSG